MAYVPIGNFVVSAQIVPTSQISYAILRPTLRGKFGNLSVAHVERREQLLGKALDREEKLIAYLIALEAFSLKDTEIYVDISKWSGTQKISEPILSSILGKYLGYLAKDGVQVRRINGVPIYAALQSSLEEKLARIFADRAGAVAGLLGAVDQEISRMESITNQSMAGLHGGVVGKAQVGETAVVFKVETDFLAAYKSMRAPYLIHQSAAHDPLAARLARRIPKPLTSFPLSSGAYWITLAEDFSHKVVPASFDDLLVMEPELQRDLKYELVEALYLAALYQEVMSTILETTSDPLLMAQSRISSNLSAQEICSRLQSSKDIYGQIKPIVEPLLASMHERNEYLAAVSSHYPHIVHGDFKAVHRRGGIILDTGCTRKDSLAIDLGRIFMDQPTAFLSASTFTSYLDSFVRIRKRLNPTYESPALLATTTLLQTMNDTLRNLGWEIQQGEYRKIEDYLSVLQRLDAIIKF